VTRTALVTGASSGIGRELARRFAMDKFDVVLVARSDDALRELAIELEGRYGIDAHAIPADLSVDDAPANVMEELAERGIEVDALVNSAGFNQYGALHETDERRMLELLHVNIAALTRLTRLALPGMVERGWGRIVNFASMAGKDGNPNLSIYSASKAAVIGLTKSLGKELATTGVLVNAIAPAVIATPMNATTEPSALAHITNLIPMKRVGRPEEVAELVAWLASDKVSFSTGAVYDISGGRATY
jgi:3-oxoacyl-[acyl-carrier protein] reductase